MDRDEEGMRVIADLHGGDSEDLLAKAEFQEIKDRVIFEASDYFGTSKGKYLQANSGRAAKAGRTRICGSATSGVCCLLCLHKLLLSWWVVWV